MKKVSFILKQMWMLIKKHKVSFLAPLFIILAVLAILVYYVGSAVIPFFIYAGV